MTPPLRETRKGCPCIRKEGSLPYRKKQRKETEVFFCSGGRSTARQTEGNAHYVKGKHLTSGKKETGVPALLEEKTDDNVLGLKSQQEKKKKKDLLHNGCSEGKGKKSDTIFYLREKGCSNLKKRGSLLCDQRPWEEGKLSQNTRVGSGRRGLDSGLVKGRLTSVGGKPQKGESTGGGEKPHPLRGKKRRGAGPLLWGKRLRCSPKKKGTRPTERSFHLFFEGGEGGASRMPTSRVREGN